MTWSCCCTWRTYYVHLTHTLDVATSHSNNIFCVKHAPLPRICSTVHMIYSAYCTKSTRESAQTLKPSTLKALKPQAPNPKPYALNP